MSRVLDEIVQEVESKAPVLKRQREEYESMQRSMTSLCNKLEQARTVWRPPTIHFRLSKSMFNNSRCYFLPGSLCGCVSFCRQEIYSLQKDKEEVKQHCESLQKDKAKMERQLEDTSSQVRTTQSSAVLWFFLRTPWKFPQRKNLMKGV